MDLPTTSVVFVFYNEPLSTLFRSIITIFERTSPELLAEIILIDDGSESSYLQEPLDLYVEKQEKLRLIRMKNRVGLIETRALGAREAIGDTVTFLDSHVEVNVGWLEPLVARIKENYKNVVYPAIDIINSEDLKWQGTSLNYVGSFTFNMDFTWDSKYPKIRPLSSDQHYHQLCQVVYIQYLINILEIGEYDLGMKQWGGENLEISFRIWQCVGRLERLPCSYCSYI